MVRGIVLFVILFVCVKLYLYRKVNAHTPRGRTLDFNEVDLPFLSKRSKKRQIFLVATMGMLAYMVGADRKISQDEMKALEKLVRDRLKLPKEGQRRAIRYFKKARNSSKPFDYYASLMKKHFGKKKEVLIMQIYILLNIAHADNIFAVNENEIIRRAIEVFGLKRVVFRYKYLAGEVEFVYEPTLALSRISHKSEPKKIEYPIDAHSYEVLGCKAGATKDEVEKAYEGMRRKFSLEHLRDKGLPSEFEEFALMKQEEIRKAYSNIVNGEKRSEVGS